MEQREKIVLALVAVAWWVISWAIKIDWNVMAQHWEISFCSVPFSVVIFPVRAFLLYSITIRHFQLHESLFSS
jgi:hypothetical protein